MAKSWAARLCRFARRRTFVAQERIKTYKNNQTKVLRNLRRNEKMEKEEKKFYESPTMTVCEISMTQILAGSGETEILDDKGDPFLDDKGDPFSNNY